ncbi:transposase [Hydrogenophaga sp.]|uniref:transposase n=1 Tax=Hydrogenophaga sp. TaxID=1904254 RepID=UPI002725189F|nr:transposase [Hydrogenophaga sp.]MDO8903252.1 transposase [Hydrogenophaga sp.]
MARLPRLSIPGNLHHVMQRGNNQQAIVKTDADRSALLTMVGEQALHYRVALHAYVLMDTHFHLLLTPATPGGISLMMQAVGRRYVRYFNDLHHRSGTLWDGRYRSTVLQAERHLIAHMCFLDLMPVRAGVTAQPHLYPWSSHCHYVGQLTDKRLVPHPVYWSLGNTPFAREAAYADRVREGLTDAQAVEIASSVNHGWALGEPDFIDGLQQQTQRRVSKARPGRPPLR